MMDNHLSKGHMATAASPPEVDLTLPTQATFNDGQSSFNRTLDNSCNPPMKLTCYSQQRQHSMMEKASFKRTPDNSCKPPEVDLILPAPATFHGGEPSFKRTPANSGKPP